MGKFLIYWKTDMSRVPEDPKEQISLFVSLTEMVKEDLKNGPTKDFGIFLSGHAGYTIEEGTEQEISLSVLKYSPYINCKVFPILSIDQLEENLKELSKGTPE